jgi:hypothetical protein
MANYYDDQIDFLRGNSSLGGLQGSPGKLRGTNAKGGLQVWRFTFTNTTSTNAGVSVVLAQNDTMDLAYLEPQCRIFGLWVGVPVAGGAGLTLSVGRVDPNNSANNSAARYLSAKDISAQILTATEVMLLFGDQVGTDELGDQSTGQTAPSFGAAPIIIRATFGGAVAAAGFSLNGAIFFANLNQA